MKLLGVQVVVIGGGPAGLMAAQAAAEAGAGVTVVEAMPAPGRKLLVAGSTGLNLSYHASLDDLVARYGPAGEWLRPSLAAFDQTAVRAWAASLGVDTFVGSSRRVFPASMDAAELLKRWLALLRINHVEMRTRHRWTGWDETGAVLCDGPAGRSTIAADATVLALGGASWPQTGSDGGWRAILEGRGVTVTPFEPADCGFDIAWSPALARFAGTPLKNVALRCDGARSVGECVLTAHGIEGQAVYALGPAPRRAIARDGHAVLELDLKRDLDHAEVARRLARPRGKRSLAEHLRRSLGLRGPAYSLLREADAATLAAGDPHALAALVKAVPLRLERPRPIAEAIATAGGIALDELDHAGGLRRLPGVSACGEMLDWEAPTGGFLLHACLATGRATGRAAVARVDEEEKP